MPSLNLLEYSLQQGELLCAGEPAKAGWDAFTADSQAIVSTHLADFQTEAVSIAQETGSCCSILWRMWRDPLPTHPISSKPRMWHDVHWCAVHDSARIQPAWCHILQVSKFCFSYRRKLFLQEEGMASADTIYAGQPWRAGHTEPMLSMMSNCLGEHSVSSQEFAHSQFSSSCLWGGLDHCILYVQIMSCI